MATQPAQLFSVAEYLERESEALDRHEYLNGEIFAMAGGTAAHADIAANIIIEVGSQLRRKPGCKIRGSDLRIRTAPSGLYSYADAVLSCADERIENETLVNPVLIVEVLSKSTESYDRGKKFEEYRRIPSFREYLVIAQDRPYVEHHVRGEQLWTMREYKDMDYAIVLEAIDVPLPLKEIYAGISFDTSLV